MKHRVYSFEIPEEFEETKLTPQIYQILSGVVESGTVEFQETALKKLVNELAEKQILKTRQNPWRIFQYYRNVIQKLGWLKLSVQDSEISEESEEAVA